jgi:hypothetical protein
VTRYAKTTCRHTGQRISSRRHKPRPAESACDRAGLLS